MTDPGEDYEAWFMRTFKEREDALGEVLGPSHPPSAPEGHVLSMSACGSGDHSVLIPGGCVHVCPPVVASRPGGPLKRSNWVYVTVGLSQPGDPEEKPRDNDRGTGLSAHGVEFGMIVADPADWIGSFFSELLGYAAAVSPLFVGHRYPFGLHRSRDGTGWFVGRPEELGIEALGDIRALLFWPYLDGPRWFTTETGHFELLCATAITGDEWEYARKTSSPHLLVLLFEAGIGQLSSFNRSSVLAAAQFRQRAEELARQSRDQVESMLLRLAGS
jgi:hypothetical protein